MNFSMDFSLLLLLLLVATGLIWAWDRFVSQPGRERRLEQLKGSERVDADELRRLEREPLLAEYARSFFPVILIVFLLRSFVVEPFRIPSGSMLPSLHIGDFILVNKFVFGLRVPVLNDKFIDVSSPKRGDVVVFRYPNDPSVNYIKRVVGLPGDRIVYANKKLYINGQEMKQSNPRQYEFEEAGKRMIKAVRLEETFGPETHDIVLDTVKGVAGPFEKEVPPGHYFVMGDNRDYSNDSRFWGFVPDHLVVGRAFFIWFSWDTANGGGVNWHRIGMSID
jgi:signal peptidase I